MVKYRCRFPAGSNNLIVLGKEVVQWVAKRTNEFGRFGTDIGIGWARAGKLVAGVAYADFSGPNIVCHIASDGSKKWLTRHYLWVVFDYPFNQVGVDRITVSVGEGNSDSRRLVEHFGFKIEARLKGAHRTGDLLIYALWKKDCRFIKSPFVDRVENHAFRRLSEKRKTEEVYA